MQRVCKSLGMLGVLITLPNFAFSQSSYVPQAGEYAPIGNFTGDQVAPNVSLKVGGGFMVWQENVVDGDGLGISAARLDSSFNSPFGTIRVNQQGAFDQEKPKVALLNNGGAVFVWQGGKLGFQHIQARFLSSANTWVTGDIMVNASTNYNQTDASVAVLTNGNVVVVWTSYDQDGSMQGVYGQQFNSTGSKIGTEFPVNQFTGFNQRTPAIASLSTGGFVVAWISEQQRRAEATSGSASVDVYGRIYGSSGVALGNEFWMNTGTNICANPTLAAASDGTFMLAWGQKDATVLNNSWDLFARSFSGAGVGGIVRRINSLQYGDQFGAQLSASGTDYLAVWTSLGQDGSREGVYGQFLASDGSLAGSEFRVNSTTAGQQKQPSISSDRAGKFLVAWTTFTDLQTSCDLRSQRYATYLEPLLPPGAPFVSAITASRLSVTWPLVGGYSVKNYELYIDGSATPTTTGSNVWTMNNLAPGSTHTFRLAYVLTDGRRSPLSATATGKTWGEDDNGDGLPDDWQAQYWGANPANWPPGNFNLVPGGLTVLQAFQQGNNPLDPSTWLRSKVVRTPQGTFLNWNTQPGYVYQVECSLDVVNPNWTAVGAPRYAAGTNDSIFLGLTSKSYFRIKRLRY